MFKIMYFLDQDQSLGGAVHTLLRQAVLMKRAGNYVVVVLSDYSGNVCEEYINFCSDNQLSILCTTFQVSSQPEDIDIVSLLKNYEPIKQIIKDEAPAILHSVQLNPTVELISRELKIPHIMNIYPAISDFFALNYMDVFPKYHICDSWYYAKVWRKYLNTESVCIRTTADRNKKIKTQFFGGKIIQYICVGGIYQEKNQLTVIKAFHKALQDGINGRLDIYGNGQAIYYQTCRKYIIENHLENHISFQGYCEDMPHVYQNSDVLICGSTRESYPNVISEALANGVIVISTPVAGVPEVVKDRENGYVSSGYDVDDIYLKIKEFNDDVRNRVIDQILIKANKTYEKEHSPKSVTNSLKNYYSDVLNNYVNKKTISIDFIRHEFQDVLIPYDENRMYFSNDKAVGVKLWYIHHILGKVYEQINKQRSFYIWGTGKHGTYVYEMIHVFFKNLKINGFIDSYKTGEHLGCTICKPDEILEQDNVILIGTVNGQHEIIDKIKSYNKKYCVDYFILATRYW